MAHLLFGQVDWLHRAGSDVPGADGVTSLSVRQRQVLFMLLEGDGRKQIAAKLHISPYTAADHIQAIYRHFEVGSQSELLAQFFAGMGPKTQPAVKIA